MPRRAAEELVRQGKAHWDDKLKRQRIYCVRGKVTGNIRDHWRIMPSGEVICVWQLVTCLVLFASISPRFFPGFHHLQNMPTPIWVTVERA